VAVISDMNQPLGRAIGNALEVKEAIETLAGKGPKDLTDLALTIGSHMLLLSGQETVFEAAYARLQEVMATGKALEKFAQMVKAQGGDERAVYDVSRLPQAAYQAQIVAKQEGYIARIKADQVGHASVLLGAGRMTKEMPIDLAVGIVLHKKCGDVVQANEAIATLHANDEALLAAAVAEVEEAIVYSAAPVPMTPLIYKVI
jgi:pyrimidine-nucleoside phosphorylase